MIVEHLQTLIRKYPFYGTEGLLSAQKYIKDHLEKSKWDRVFLDTYQASDISGDKRYVAVHEFGSPYDNYQDVEKYNVVAIKDGGLPGPTVILNGHVDVDIVDESRSWLHDQGWKSGIMQDGKLYGRGAADMLGGLSCQMACASRFIDHNPCFKGRLIFTSVCDEEIGGNGTLRSLLLLEEEVLITPGSLAVIAEPSENKVCLDSLGFMHFVIECSRTPLHMGIAEPDNNALNSINHLISNFELIMQEFIESRGLSEFKNLFKFNFGKIKGGIDPAIPIGNITLEGTIFFPDIVTDVEIFMSLQKVIEPQFGLSIRLGEFGFPGASFTNNLKSYFSSLEQGIFPSPCDARLFKSFGIMAAIWGPGSLRQAHSINEFIHIEDLLQYESTFYQWLCQTLGTSHG
ncbi:M20 family metallopeptidase [Candidatus Odyssella thessalonicensis]|uniref:M20 family metallopeptidase n=1 Tax=Candidatus Odyssella thessalonicensis TaxID=84647 RepID=UPI000225A99A|nr:M20/M25/M40 family metallo-hydrolase [Candidatus Odyssella thessalonicensis]